MKSVTKLLVIAFCFGEGILAFAQSAVLVKKEKLAVADGLQILLTVTDEGEPAIKPIKVIVEVLCEGGLRKKFLLEKTCEYVRYEMNKNILTIHFLEAEFVKGTSICKTPRKKTIKITSSCA